MNQLEPQTFTNLDLDWDAAFGASATGPGMTESCQAGQAPESKQPGQASGTRQPGQTPGSRQPGHMSVSDALIMSLNNRGRVDMDYISGLSGKDPARVAHTLKGSIYRDPERFTDGTGTAVGNPFRSDCWVTKEQYLSGNLVRKLRAAASANRMYPGVFAENIRAIKEVLPTAISADDIYVTLGSPWVPAEVIDDFIDHILGIKSMWLKTSHDVTTGSWDIRNKNGYNHIAANTRTYGTPRINALQILEKTLNMKTIVITDEEKCSTTKSGVHKVVNRQETIAANEKQEKLIAEFRRWIWKDAKRKKKLEEIFAENFGCVRRRVFDGSFLEFPAMAPAVQLYPYQKDAVARIIFSPNTLLAHDVGSGKTYVMIAAAMELKRLGLSSKNMFVVPNNLVGQWKQIFEEMYPAARLLCVEPKSFVPSRRQAVLRDMRDGSYDGIIIAYSCFDMIPLSKDHYTSRLRERLKEAYAQLDDVRTSTSLLRRRIKQMEEELSKLTLEKKDPKVICFDSFKVTRLFVDEAHNYKNVPISTQASNMPGITPSGSDKCALMLEKVRHVQHCNNGGGVVFATGTPITNSITDAYIMQLYLQGGELKLLDLGSFDAWVGMFAEKVTGFEIDVDTSSYRLVTSFARFHNLPELTGLLASVADFHQIGAGSELPAMDGYTDRMLPRSVELSSYLEEISKRADDVRNRRVRSTEDNMLLITTDGRKAALDLRLVRDGFIPVRRQKVDVCAENVASIYFATEKDRSTQLVFCDYSTPKQGFNLYDELKGLLVSKGIPADTIRYAHEASTEARRGKLYEAVRKGEVRILIGSTVKLGQGVNIQDKLIALHHMDVPWRPADMTQREGRILRQGNTNPVVQIYRYITEGSFDAYSWQLLETKQRFIADLLSGSITARCGSDIEDTVLGYAEVKALAVGNPLMKERVETANDLTRLMLLQKKTLETRAMLRQEWEEIPGLIEAQTRRVEACRKDSRFVTEVLRAGKDEKHKKTGCKNRTGAGSPMAGDSGAARSAAGMTKADKEAAGMSKAEKEAAAEERKHYRRLLADAIRERIYSTEEYTAMTYRGFDVIIPAYVSADKPRVLLRREGRYALALGDTEIGNLRKIDNFIDGLSDHLKDLEAGLDKLLERRGSIEKALAGREDYSEDIRKTERKLSLIDKKIGLEKAS